jgi:signal transduction histidine kinase
VKIRLQILLLLSCLLTVFIAATGVLSLTHRREVEGVRHTLELQRANLVDRILLLTSQSLRGYANDYSLWDEMLKFVGTGDPAWAQVNIEASVGNFDVRTVWVLRPDGSVVYRSGDAAANANPSLPFGDPEFLTRLRRERMMHFYLDSPAGLLEVCSAPIQPSDDVRRVSPPAGWLIATRLWNDQHLKTLADALQCQIAFAPSSRHSPSMVSLERDLTDWQGKVVRRLYVDYESMALTRLIEGNVEEFWVLFSLGSAMIALTAFTLTRWILSPLRRLGESLESGRPDPLTPLQARPNEFGHLAQLVRQSFEQRAALEREIRERSRLAETLQETSAQLRESVELRSRLARDLHDGVIQAIYAAGIGLEGVRTLLRTNPEEADRRLAASQQALNSTIRDVRAFINGLESEVVVDRPFRQTLATLVATMQSVQPGDIRLEVDEAVARRVSPTQEMQLLHILRESLSNALRHAGPAQITLTLQAGSGDEALLTIADDGCGFDPAAPANRGRGLVNLGIRARELGGTLEIQSAPAKGTRVVLRFLPTYPP